MRSSCRDPGFTVELWAHLGDSSEHVIVNRRGATQQGVDNAGWSLAIRSTRVEATVFGRFDHFSTLSTELLGWHHLAWVYDDGDSTLYIDGVASTPATCSSGGTIVGTICRHDSGTSAIATVAPLRLGQIRNVDGTPRSHVAGGYDELRISTVARYQADFAPARRFDADPDTLVLFHFDEGEGMFTLNESSTRAAGSLEGGVTWQADDGYDRFCGS